MNTYIEWLQTCVNNIWNIKIGDVSSYGMALLWQLALLGTILLTLVILALGATVLLFTPFICARQINKRIIKQCKDLNDRTLTSAFLGEIQGFAFYYRRENQHAHYKIAEKYSKTLSILLGTYAGIILFLLFPFIMTNKYIQIVAVLCTIVLIIINIVMYASEYEPFFLCQRIAKRIANKPLNTMPARQFMETKDNPGGYTCVDLFGTQSDYIYVPRVENDKELNDRFQKAKDIRLAWKEAPTEHLKEYNTKAAQKWFQLFQENLDGNNTSNPVSINIDAIDDEQ